MDNVEPAPRARRALLAITTAALGMAAVLVGCSNSPGLPSAGQPDAAGGSVTVTVPDGPAAAADSPPTATRMDAAPGDGGQLGAASNPLGPLPGGEGMEDTTPWPAPPADPTGPVDQAVAAAASSGVREAVVVLDRTTGAVLTQVDQDLPFPALSLVKLMIAADVVAGGDGTDSTSTDSTSTDAASSDAPSTGAPSTDAPSTDAPNTDASSTDASSGEAPNTGAQGPDSTTGNQAGKVTPGVVYPSTRAQLREMIARSDDVTASDFYDAGGGDQLIERVAAHFGLTGTTPTPDGQYWGNVQTTAADMASLLAQALADPAIGPVIGPDMLVTTAIAQDGIDQRIGMRTVPGAGSKQGWGCCLSGVVGIHSVGFTSSRIVVVLSSAEPDDDSLGEQDGLALQADPGAQVSMAAVTDTVRAALAAPAH